MLWHTVRVIALDMAIPTHPNTPTHADGLSALIAGIPRDQALGLRLIGLARAAAACHLAQALPTTPGARFTPGAHEGAATEGDAQVLRTQAARLALMMDGRAA